MVTVDFPDLKAALELVVWLDYDQRATLRDLLLAAARNDLAVVRYREALGVRDA